MDGFVSIHDGFKTARRRVIPPYFPWLSLLPVPGIFAAVATVAVISHPEMHLDNIFR